MGGAICFLSGSAVNISQSTFRNNAALSIGGAVQLQQYVAFTTVCMLAVQIPRFDEFYYALRLRSILNICKPKAVRLNSSDVTGLAALFLSKPPTSVGMLPAQMAEACISREWLPSMSATACLHRT